MFDTLMLYLKDYISKVEKYLQTQTLISMQRVSPLKFSVNVTFVIVSTEEISDNEKGTLLKTQIN